jgi:hypothetical protein
MFCSAYDGPLASATFCRRAAAWPLRTSMAEEGLPLILFTNREA